LPKALDDRVGAAKEKIRQKREQDALVHFGSRKEAWKAGDSNTAGLRLDAPDRIASQPGFQVSTLMQREVRLGAAADHRINVERIIRGNPIARIIHVEAMVEPALDQTALEFGFRHIDKD
jgi:hypothetical protein